MTEVEEEVLKKVLIITYYWPPSGGSGVQRWLKFVKYLPSFGWTPYVFTPENPAFDIKDFSLLKDVPQEAEVFHFPIWEPYKIFNRLSGTKKGASSANSAPKPTTFFKRLSIWIRGNFFIPDPRIFWVRPSIKFLDDFIKENKIRTIITTGPPHSVHLIGLGLKKRNTQINWIADFRDPWSEWGFLETLSLTPISKKIIRNLERRVLTMANTVLTVTPSWVAMFKRLSGRKVHLLTNGFDEDDFKEIKYEHASTFMIRHIGVVNERCNPRPFMHAFENLCKTNKRFADSVKIEFIGEVHADFKSFVASNNLLSAKTTFINAIPHDLLLKSY